MGVDDVDIDGCIRRSCDLDGQPVSGRSLGAIVEFYQDGSYLAESMKRSQADRDFKTKFIEDNEAYVQFGGVDRYFLRVCHNIRSSDRCDEVFLFIHGLGGNLEQFEPLLRLLDETGKRFLALDLPGFGKSDEWNSYCMYDVVEAIRQAVDKIVKSRVQGKLTIVGHSMGCYLSVHYYLKYHQDVNRLVLLAPPKPNVDYLAKSRYWIQIGLHTGLKFPWLFDIYRERFDQCRGLKSSGIRQFFHREGGLMGSYRKLWQFHNNVQIKSRSIFGYFLGWREIDWNKLNETLAKAGAQTSLVIMCGDQDEITPVQYSSDASDLLPDANSKKLIIIKNCGHNLCFDYPEMVLKEFYENVLSELR
ncbi:hypothetical protein HG537_0C01240 [Torulaspora globosa]|uniref:AB hydrolase-1 domain-containing protein n=1 Tax=Torulaspora globosa TaxID=48254 RepID=A0A7H9HS15_9SACH|nr:hypothetical protein HG537_0C01240 [Torulaspora sp. CBS 2947]